jgi:hypothetical protein
MRHDHHPVPSRRRASRRHDSRHWKKEDSEVSEARALLADPQVRLENALLTADPRHNQEATLRVIIEKGGDYLIGTKGNTSNRFDAVEKALESTPFLT